MPASPLPEQAALALAVEDVSKSYGSVKALDRVSLHVARGEFVALLGPNGAGKSTLFQLLTGLFVPDAGRIEVAGFDMRHRARRALACLGVVFQQPTLDLDLSVVANLRFHTVGLDPASREQLVAYVHSLCTHRDVGVLWATHLVDEAESADRVIILHKGHWIASGTAAELRERTGKRSLRDAFLDLTGEASVEQEEAV